MVRLSALALPAALLLGPVTRVGYSLGLLPVLAFLGWTPRVVFAAVLLCLTFWLVIDLGRAGNLAVQFAQTLYGVGALLLMGEAMLVAGGSCPGLSSPVLGGGTGKLRDEPALWTSDRPTLGTSIRARAP
jgi:hypothetical protein